jgi:uncharacterized protein (UPF0548 family)
MFLTRRPSQHDIDRFLDDSRERPLSYGPIGLVRQAIVHGEFDEQVIAIGHGQEDFERARGALMKWKQFDIGWVEAFPRQTGVKVGTVSAILIRHLGFWSLNGVRVLYCVGSAGDGLRFGFAYGTLTNHAESGEELFEVFIDPHTTDVMYRIRAISWPQATLARIGQPIVRALQARFRRDSAIAMKRATSATRSEQTPVHARSTQRWHAP